MPPTSLFEIIRQKDLTGFQHALITKGVDIHAFGSSGKGAIHRAAELGLTPFVKTLLDAGVSPNTSDAKGNLPLFYAVRGIKGKPDNLETVQLLIERGASYVIKDQNGGSLLHLASKAGHLKTLQYLINLGLDINDLLHNENTLLHTAVRHNQLACTQELLERGLSPSVKNRLGETALHLAARGSCEKILTLLLRHSEDIEARSYEDLTPLHEAVEANQLALVNGLLDAGSNANARLPRGGNALHLAVVGNPDIVAGLLKAGADPNCVNERGQTPLHILALKTPWQIKHGKSDAETFEKIARLLLRAGANPHIHSLNGKTPTDYYAAGMNHNTTRWHQETKQHIGQLFNSVIEHEELINNTPTGANKTDEPEYFQGLLI